MAPAGNLLELDGWRTTKAAAAAAIAEGPSQAEAPSGAGGGRRAGPALPAGTTVFTASSMPVRDVETFWPARDDPPRVLVHRGANGIDGTVAAAFGAAAAGDGPVVLHIGDIALVHDVGALPGRLAAGAGGWRRARRQRRRRGSSRGFFLPVATQTDAFEEHVATPTGLDFARVAALFELGYAAPGTMAEVRAALETAVAAGGTTLIHVRTDRADNALVPGH